MLAPSIYQAAISLARIHCAYAMAADEMSARACLRYTHTLLSAIIRFVLSTGESEQNGEELSICVHSNSPINHARNVPSTAHLAITRPKHSFQSHFEMSFAYDTMRTPTDYTRSHCACAYSFELYTVLYCRVLCCAVLCVYSVEYLV